MPSQRILLPQIFHSARDANGSTQVARAKNGIGNRNFGPTFVSIVTAFLAIADAALLAQVIDELKTTIHTVRPCV